MSLAPGKYLSGLCPVLNVRSSSSLLLFRALCQALRNKSARDGHGAPSGWSRGDSRTHSQEREQGFAHRLGDWRGHGVHEGEEMAKLRQSFFYQADSKVKEADESEVCSRSRADQMHL